MKKLLTLVAFCVSPNLVAHPYIQPMEPQNEDDITLRVGPSGKINLEGETFFQMKDGRTKGVNELNEEVNENRLGLDRVSKKAEKDVDQSRAEILTRDLKGYIDFQVEKSHVGEFYGAKRDRISDRTGLRAEKLGDIPADSDHLLLRDFDEKRPMAALTVGGKAPKNGRRLTVTNLSGAKHLGFTLGCSNCVSKGPGSPGTILVEPSRSMELVYYNGAWHRVSGYRGIKSRRDEAILSDHIHHYRKRCDNSSNCYGSCPNGTYAVAVTCGLHGGEEGVRITSKYANHSPGRSKGTAYCFANKRGNIEVMALCLRPNVSD